MIHFQRQQFNVSVDFSTIAVKAKGKLESTARLELPLCTIRSKDCRRSRPVPNALRLLYLRHGTRTLAYARMSTVHFSPK